jgi:hypothetical protein
MMGKRRKGRLKRKRGSVSASPTLLFLSLIKSLEMI